MQVGRPTCNLNLNQHSSAKKTPPKKHLGLNATETEGSTTHFSIQLNKKNQPNAKEGSTGFHITFSEMLKL